MRRVSAEIDAAALAHNLGVVRERAPKSRIYAIVKADAYGHGLIPAARVFAAAGAEGFGVACVEEALELRESGIRQRILVLEGVSEARELKLARAAELELVVHVDWQLEMLERDGAAGFERLWIKFNTGMHRLGFPAAEAEAVRARLETLRIPEPGLMSHLACADEPEREETAQQLAAFERLCKLFPGPASLANSAGTLAHPSSHFDWVRPGLVLYGVSPFAGRDAQTLGLRPAMNFASRLIAVREVAAGESVGYGGDWRAPRASRIGTVSVGYGDGYPWRAARGGVALVRGHRVPLVGRVSMDMLAVDLTEFPDARVHDPVTLWGAGLSVEELARVVGTTAYELVCSVTRRVPRAYGDAEAAMNPAAA